MIKRAMVISVITAGVVCASVVAMLPSDVEAHLAGTVSIGGYLRHVSSLACGIAVKGVPNPDTNPSELVCTATITLVEFLCENPTNHQTSPGTSGRRTVIVGTTEFNAANIDKKKGTGTAEAHLETDFVVTNEDCVNPNWNVLPDTIIVKEVGVQFETAECTGAEPTPCSSFVVAYREVRACLLPNNFGYGKKQQGAPPEGTEYDCTLLSQEHLR
jgi:hypothetical protein